MIRIMQSGSGDTRDLVVLYLVGAHLDDAIRLALGPDPCIAADVEGKPGESLDALVATCQERAHFTTLGRIVLVGYSLGCSGVRARLLEDGASHAAIAALVLIDGTHASSPPAAWQLDVWKRPFERARAGEILVVATHTLQTYVEHLTPAGRAFLSTVSVLRRLTGFALEEAGPPERPVEQRDGQLWVYSYQSASIDANA